MSMCLRNVSTLIGSSLDDRFGHDQRNEYPGVWEGLRRELLQAQDAGWSAHPIRRKRRSFGRTSLL